MTCTTVGFGVFSHKGICREGVSSDCLFDDGKTAAEKHQVSLLMYGAHREYHSNTTLQKCSLKRRHDQRASATTPIVCGVRPSHDLEQFKLGGQQDSKSDPHQLKAEVKGKNGSLSWLCTCRPCTRTTDHTRRLRCRAHEPPPKEISNSDSLHKSGSNGGPRIRSLMLCLARGDPERTFAVNFGNGCYDRTISRTVVAAASGRSYCSSRVDKGRQHTDRKRISTDTDINTRARKRRKSDDEDIDDDESEDGTWSKGQQLAPVSCNLITALPHKDDQRQTGSMDVDDGYGSPPTSDLIACKRPRKRSVIILDQEGNTVAPISITSDVSLPEVVVNELEQHFAKEGEDEELRKQKLQHYKEGLEKGIKEFLSQGIVIDDYISSENSLSASSLSPSAQDTGSKVHACAASRSGACHSSRETSCASQNLKHRHKRSKLSIDKAYAKGFQKLSSITGTRHKGCGNQIVSNGYGQGHFQGRFAEEGHLMLEASQGFMLVLDKQRRVLYVSQNVPQHLGYQQVSMLGWNIDDYIHPKDLPQFLRHVGKEQFQSGAEDSIPVWMCRRMFYVGMKFCFQKPGSRAKDSGYTLVQWNVKLRLKRKEQGVEVAGILALCRPVRTHSVLEIRMEGNMFISRHDMSFQFIYCDPRIINLIGYEPSDLIGRTAYQFHSPWDALICKQCHKNLMLEGAADSGYYRFLSRTGVWVWMVTQATIVYDTMRNPQYIVCKNNIVSREEAERHLSKEKKSYEDMKCLGFSLETDLPVFDSLKSSNRTLASYQKLPDFDTESLLQELFGPEPDNVTSSPLSWSGKQGDISAAFNTGAEVGQGSQNGQLIADVHEIPTVGHDNFGNSSSFSFGQSDMVNTSDIVDSLQLREDTNFNQTDLGADTVNSMFGTTLGDGLDSDMNYAPGQHSTLPMLPIQTTTNIYNFSFEDDDCDFLSGHFMTDPFSDQMQETPLDSQSLKNTQASCKLQETQFSGGNNLPSKSAVSNGAVATMGKECNTSSRTLLASGYQPNSLCGKNMPNERPESDDTSSLSGSKAHSATCSSQNRPTSKLASLLQKGYTSPTSVSKRSDLCHASMANVIKKPDNVSILKNTLLYNVSGRPDQQNITLSSDNSDRIDRNPSALRNALTQSDQSTGQVPSFVSKDSTPSSSLCHQILTSAESCNSQTNINYLNKKKNTCSQKTTESLSSGSKSSSESCYKSKDITSVLTNRKFDPFLCELPVSEMNLLPDLDRMEEDLPGPSSTTSPLLSSIAPSLSTTATDDRQTYLSLESSGSSHAFLDALSSSSTSDPSFSSGNMGELECFLNDIPSSSGLITSMNEAMDSQSIPFTEQLGFGPDSITTPSTMAPDVPDSQSSSGSGSTESSDSENSSSRPSLLRTLLDREGAAIQGPLTYTEWILEQALRKKSEMKKAKGSNGTGSSRHSGTKRVRGSKNPIRKSTELPLPRSSHIHMLRCGKDGGQPRKPTKELPLPQLTKTTSSQSPLHAQLGALLMNENSQDSSTMSSESQDSALGLHSPDASSEDFNLPDDLIDLVVERYTSLGSDQAEALLSDLNNTCSLEDDLFALIGSPAQARSSNPSQGSQLQQSEQSQSAGLSFPTESLCSPSGGVKKDLSQKSFPLSISVAQSAAPSNGKSLLNKSLTKTLPLVSKSGSGPKVSPIQSANNSPPKSGKMSLLRAAVTSPDVDKLIEQIPLGNTKKYQQSCQGKFPQPMEDQDIVITKVTGLQKSPPTCSPNMPHGRVFKIPSTSPVKSVGKPSPPHAQSPPGLIGASDHMDAVLFDHFYTSSLSGASVGNSQTSSPITSSSSSVSSSSGPTIIRKRAGSSPLPLKISISSESSSKGLNATKNTHQITKEKSSSSSPRPSSTSQTSPSSPRAKGITNTDLSSSQPVSVMIMRKEHHRSRRSKSIGIQTDNEPGEVYPEFERSPSDTILYPSVTISPPPPPPPVTPLHRDMSPAASTSSSPPSMSELEKFLRGYSGGDDSCSSSADEEGKSCRSRSNTPFLQKLLTGELSRDHYQRLDQQLLERERRESVSSGSELD